MARRTHEHFDHCHLGGNGRTDHHPVEFTRDGKFVMQIGRKGQSKGNKEFYVMHHMNVDAKGNLYVTEVQDGKRIQKFVFKGLTSR